MDEEFIVIRNEDDIFESFSSARDAVKWIGEKKKTLKDYDANNPKISYGFHIYKLVGTI